MRATVVVWVAFAACAPLHRYPDGTGIEGQLEREVVALQMRLHELEAIAEDAPSSREADPLVGELLQVFGGSEVAVVEQPGGAMVLAPTEVVFADAVALRLRDESAMLFDLLATALNLHPEHSVTITGHTSDRPIPTRRGTATPDHLELGAAQAMAFARHLHTNYQVDLARITIASRGYHAPMASNDLPEGQDQNERLEIRLLRPSAVETPTP